MIQEETDTLADFFSKYSRGELNYSLFQTLPSQQLSVQS